MYESELQGGVKPWCLHVSSLLFWIKDKHQSWPTEPNMLAVPAAEPAADTSGGTDTSIPRHEQHAVVRVDTSMMVANTHKRWGLLVVTLCEETQSQANLLQVLKSVGYAYASIKHAVRCICRSHFVGSTRCIHTELLQHYNLMTASTPLRLVDAPYDASLLPSSIKQVESTDNDESEQRQQDDGEPINRTYTKRPLCYEDANEKRDSILLDAMNVWKVQSLHNWT